MFAQCHEMQGNLYNQQQVQFGSNPPKSVADYLAERDIADETARKRQEEATQLLEGEDERLRREQERDELDDLLDEESNDVDKPCLPRRMPGCSGGSFTKAQNGSTKQQAPKKSLSQASTMASTNTMNTPLKSISGQATQGVTPSPSGEEKKPSSLAGSKGKAVVKGLDASMQMVCNKHVDQGGSSSKTLANFDPTFFLVRSDNRYPQSGKLRGVPMPNLVSF